jgi:hypothetical protein
VSDDKKDPRIDWMAQLRNTLLILVAVVAILMLMRYFGLRG